CCTETPCCPQETADINSCQYQGDGCRFQGTGLAQGTCKPESAQQLPERGRVEGSGYAQEVGNPRPPVCPGDRQGPNSPRRPQETEEVEPQYQRRYYGQGTQSTRGNERAERAGPGRDQPNERGPGSYCPA